jgi:hypothetical protein
MADCDALLPYIQPGWVGVEVGVSEGRSSLAFVQKGVKFLYLIDPWEGEQMCSHAVCRELLKPYDRGHEFAWLRMKSDVAHEFVPEGINFVFIDGDHHLEQVRRDLENYWPKLKYSGLLCGHDYTDNDSCQVKTAVDDFVAKHRLALTVFPDVSSCWLVRKV